MQQFERGETVQLLSGGPGMTVQQHLSDGDVRCQWFAGSELSSGDFRPESLKKLGTEASTSEISEQEYGERVAQLTQVD
jgi:uncharacterized protein YodC (DUF2158 family)